MEGDWEIATGGGVKGRLKSVSAYSIGQLVRAKRKSKE